MPTMTRSTKDLAAIVLCGGASRRMGRPKHALPFGEETALQRMVNAVRGAVGTVVVVGAPEQVVSELPASVRISHDEQPQLGPLAGFQTGLAALKGRAQALFLTGCDMPLLSTAMVEFLLERLDGEVDAVVPVLDGIRQPLAGTYRVSVAAPVNRLLAAGERSLQTLLREIRTREIPAEELRAIDPKLLSLRTMNTPEEYAELLRASGNE